MIEQTIDLWQAGMLADAICLTTNGTIKRNGQGVMGRGVALQAASMWRYLPSQLGAHLAANGNHVGFLTHVQAIPSVTNGRPRPLPIAILAFPVKVEWNEKANTVLIARSLIELVSLTDAAGWKKVILPRPGCGNGGLTWETDVKPMVERLDDRFVVVTK